MQENREVMERLDNWIDKAVRSILLKGSLQLIFTCFMPLQSLKS